MTKTVSEHIYSAMDYLNGNAIDNLTVRLTLNRILNILEAMNEENICHVCASKDNDTGSK